MTVESDMEVTLKSKYPAKAHCQRVARYLTDQNLPSNGIIYLEAQKTRMVEDDDQAQHFRQRRAFFYLSGCNLPDSYLTYNISENYLTLFIPPIDDDSVIWSGLPESPEEAMRSYDVDSVKFTNEVNSSLESSPSGITVYSIPEQVSEEISFKSFHSKNTTHLRTAIDECRVIKDTYEIALIRKANHISTIAHMAAYKQTPDAKHEYELYGAFVGTCISNGAPEQAYHSICASGTSCGTLHYVRNDQPLTNHLNILMDAGAEYRNYCADITRTYPVNGTFTKESKEIYDLVDKMQSESFTLLKGGVKWEQVHEKAHRVAIDGLLSLGILVGDEEELFEKRVSVAFMPHGLGHYLGLDTHDTGGHADYEDPDPMFKYLRVRGNVPAGAVITVEPGIYFCRFIIEPLLKKPEMAKYIDEKVLERYWEVGGVRIEDDILITEDGYENLTDTPKL